MNLLLFTPSTLALVRVNEIYPAPASGEQEWVELYNDENISIDISNYSLIDAANNKISLPSTIEPLSFITATSSNVLNNSGDTVNIKNELNEIIESVTYSGSFNAEKTYAKCPDGNGIWLTLTTITQNQPNPCPSPTPSPTPELSLTLTPTLTSSPTVEPTLSATIEAILTTITPSPTETIISPTIIYTITPTVFFTPTATPTPIIPVLVSYNNIYISEAMIYPQTGENEWVELYNDNDHQVQLQNWFLDDVTDGGSSPKSFSLTIPAKGYGIIDLSTSIFNNNGDHVRLLDFNKTDKNEFNYSSSERGKTWGRIDINKDSFCLQEPSKNQLNNVCVETELAENETNQQLENPTQIPQQSIQNKKTSATAIKKPHSQTTVQKIKPPEIVKNFPLSVQEKNQGVVLGITVENNYVNYPLMKGFSFSSFSFSLLALFSILYKIKLELI